MSLKEQLQKKSILKPDEFEEFCEFTKLSGINVGIIFAKNQFDRMTDQIKTHEGICPGLWNDFQFHPKSQHIILKKTMFTHVVFPTVAFSEQCNYFRWVYGPGMIERWLQIAEAVAHIKSGLVLLENDKTFHFYENKSSKYKFDIWIGGGRGYYESSARPYMIEPNDQVIEPHYTMKSN